MKVLLTVTTLLFTLSACTWVKPTEEAESVAIATSDDVGQCERLGKTTTVSKAKVAGIKRGEKFTAELATLAQNQAVTMGGNTIVADGAPEGDQQTFIVYRCES